MFKFKFLGLGIAAVALAAISLVGPAKAVGPSADACESAVITEDQAKGLARDFMSDLGYGTTPFSLLRYKMKSAVCVNGQWRVSLTMSQYNSRARKGVVLVNCHSGKIEEA